MATDVAQKPQDAAQVVLPMMLLGDENEDDEDMSNYHRIRVRVTPQISRVKVRGDKDDGWHDATIELLNLVGNVFALLDFQSRYRIYSYAIRQIDVWW